MNKKGFIKIIEAFIAVLLVAGVLLFVVVKNNPQFSIEEKVIDLEKSVLNEIARNEGYRERILQLNEDIEITETTLIELTEIWSTINFRIQSSNLNLDFRIKVCQLDVICPLSNYPDKDVYTYSVAITSNLTTYKPKQLKLFAWEK